MIPPIWATSKAGKLNESKIGLTNILVAPKIRGYSKMLIQARCKTCFFHTQNATAWGWRVQKCAGATINGGHDHEIQT
nr:MAG TPA: hypothetical protein [Caudoviricetes sp.]